MVDISIIAPCGIFCGACRQYLVFKNKLLEERGLKIGCKGCRIRNKNCVFIRRDCPSLRKNEINYCFQCNKFPCQNLKKIDKTYSKRYSLSLIENLKKIEKIGEDQWLQEQEDLYTCPDCGVEICIHDEECYKCGNKINPNIKKRRK